MNYYSNENLCLSVESSKNVTHDMFESNSYDLEPQSILSRYACCKSLKCNVREWKLKINPLMWCNECPVIYTGENFYSHGMTNLMVTLHVENLILMLLMTYGYFVEFLGE